MAHMMVKWSKEGNGTKKWRKILVIAEGKMSLSRDTESKMNIYDRQNEVRGKIYSEMLKKR